MFIKRFMFLLLSTLTIFLSGCTKISDRIYVICKTSSEGTYCYKSETDFYKQVDDDLIKISGIELTAKPALQLIPNSGEYIFTYQLPGLYKGTLESVSAYVDKLKADGNLLEIVYSDCNDLEIVLTCETSSTRILFNVRGDVRIYAVDNAGKPLEPLFI